MAKKMKPADAATVRGVAASDLKRVVKDINRHKENASENSGLAGQATKQAIEQYGLDRKALTFVVGLSRNETAKQQGTLRGVLDYADKLGMFDWIDMFDDMIPTLERIVQRARDREGATEKGDPVVQGMLGTQAPSTH
ncbi:hypothetical protein [Kaistia sp. MMO-174]|uniref:hypothetical protein n=1 Tax=Kaistia sp. MMO-174 TaxID=3081256 RepID=UPI00301943DE